MCLASNPAAPSNSLGLAPNEFDFLERLRSRATAFSLADREQKTLNLPLTLDR